MAENEASGDLGSPLLGEQIITLNGDSVDLRDLLLGGIVAGVEHSCEADMSIYESRGGAEEETSSPGPTSNFSVDDNRSSFTTTNRHFSESTQKGRTIYHRVARKLSTFISSGSGCLWRGGNSDINENHNTRQITQISSLSSSKSTPHFLKLLIPPLLIFNHIIFFQAQVQPMWNLAYKTNVTITATATTLKSKAAYDTLNLPHDYTYENNQSKIVETFTYMDAIRKLWKGDGLGDAKTLSKVAAALLVLFSGIWPHLKLLLLHFCWFFPFSHRLRLKSNHDNTGDSDEYGIGSSERQCNNNICCSNGHAHNSCNRRSPFLRTLSTLGKWSLADVLVVCILIAVLHLDWKVNPYEIRSGVENELPAILQYVKGKYPDVDKNCEQLLGYPCEVGKALVIHYPQCLACRTLIANAFNHPEWATSEGKDIMEGIELGGGGYAQLRVMGMIGTYYFCASVILSILLSSMVDFFDEKDRYRVEEALVGRKRELDFILSEEDGNNCNLEHALKLRRNEDELSAPLTSLRLPPSNQPYPLATTPSPRRAYRVSNSFHFATNYSGLRPPIPSPTTNSRLLKYVIMSLFSIVSLPFVYYSVTLPTMQRLVYGGVPTLLHEVVGMVWEQEYSLITLVKTTGDAGGWDKFLMLTFGMFVVVGPIIRAVCLTLHACLGVPVALLQDCIERPRHRTNVRLVLYHATSELQKALRPTIDFFDAFCSWEVLTVALIMIQLEMPSITDTIYQDDKCQEADPEHGRTCIEVQFNALDEFLIIIVSFFILALASSFAMTLASSESEQPPFLYEDEKRYEYGQPIPTSDVTNSGDDRYSPLQQHEDGLEQIVFV